VSRKGNVAKLSRKGNVAKRPLRLNEFNSVAKRFNETAKCKKTNPAFKNARAQSI
jgi:hypothetical protein